MLETVKAVKYLGVTIQGDLCWDDHINNIVSKANKTLGFLRRNLKISSRSVKEQAYKAFVRPILEYASNSIIFNKKLDDPTQLILMFEVTDLVGIVSLLYGLHRDMAPCELLVPTLAITVGDCACRTTCPWRYSTSLCCSVLWHALGEEGMWLEFWHMGYLILYSSHHLCEDLLHMASYLILYSSLHLCGAAAAVFPALPVFQRPPPHCCSLPRPHLMLIQPPLQQTHPRTGAKLCAPHQLHRDEDACAAASRLSLTCRFPQEQ
ncbi:hypothetical protein ACOMHN_000376 [Nucella lapillus]